MLIDGLDGVPEFDVLCGEGDRLFVMFHQGGGRARVYLIPGLSGQHRFAGPTGTQKFLESCALSCYPWSHNVAAGTPAGPCATYRPNHPEGLRPPSQLQFLFRQERRLQVAWAFPSASEQVALHA